MFISEFSNILNSFIEKNRNDLGDIILEISDSPLIDISIFPDEEYKLPKSNKGIYLFFCKQTDKLLYIGISTNLSKRIYKHIGPGFSWSRGHNKAHFPNVTLTDGRSWVSDQTKTFFQNAEINIITIGVDPPEASRLLESYIIFYCFNKKEKPELNVEF